MYMVTWFQNQTETARRSGTCWHNIFSCYARYSCLEVSTQAASLCHLRTSSLISLTTFAIAKFSQSWVYANFSNRSNHTVYSIMYTVHASCTCIIICIYTCTWGIYSVHIRNSKELTSFSLISCEMVNWEKEKSVKTENKITNVTFKLVLHIFTD